jgi:alpha-methylacyl-CoA racemase
MAGHDINYLAVSGVLNLLGSSGQPPSPPGNILADYAGGGLTAFSGVLLAIVHRSLGGKGQIVEANMVDGVSYLGTIPRLRSKEPGWNGMRGTNLLDGGCPYYRCYECKDPATYMAVGALEPQFFANLLQGLDIRHEDLGVGKVPREDSRLWPSMHLIFEKRFKQKTRKEWESVFDKIDACVTPVLDLSEMEKSGYQQRPLVHLQKSPAKHVIAQWGGQTLKPGTRDQETLKEWMNWEAGRDYSIGEGRVISATVKVRL